MGPWSASWPKRRNGISKFRIYCGRDRAREGNWFRGCLSFQGGPPSTRREAAESNVPPAPAGTGSLKNRRQLRQHIVDDRVGSGFHLRPLRTPDLARGAWSQQTLPVVFVPASATAKPDVRTKFPVIGSTRGTFVTWLNAFDETIRSVPRAKSKSAEIRIPRPFVPANKPAAIRVATPADGFGFVG
jgi:hypothetical protein